MENSILRFENVTVQYDKHTVLRDFSCDVTKGEFVSLIGPNGSGKSTMVNAVMGTVPLAGGEIYLGGKNNREYTAKERSRFAAVVPQYFTTGFGFRVRDVVMMGRNPYLRRLQSETPQDIAIVEESLRLTNTYHLKDRKITSLSGGERQRVVIAGALAQKPKLLILDEPTNHLDIHHNLEIMQLIKELNQQDGITVFAVLHDINMAARFSDRIILLNEGEQVKTGSVREVICEETLKPVYQIDMVVRNNRLTDSLEVVPLRMNKEKVSFDGKRVHVVCGGGSGEIYLEELRNRGYRLSCGVVNIGDSDYEVCQSLDIQMVQEKPYSDISEEAYRENLHLIAESEVVILTDVAIGRGNLRNVEALNEAKGKILFIKSENRDYTHGAASRILDKLITQGRAEILEKQELLRRIAQKEL